MIKPVQKDGKTYVCVHWQQFPPSAALICKYEEINLDGYWRSGRLKETDYRNAQVWEKICGKFVIDEACMKCPHLRTAEIQNMLPCLVSLDGKISVPYKDIPTLDSLSPAPVAKVKK